MPSYFNKNLNKIKRIERIGSSLSRLLLACSLCLQSSFAAAQGVRVDLEADRVSDDGEVIRATGAAQMDFQEFLLCAEHIRYWREAQRVELQEAVQIKHEQLQVSADYGSYSIQNKQGEVRRFATQTPKRQIYLRGDVLQLRDKVFSAQDVVITSCARDKEVWHLTADAVQDESESDAIVLDNVWLNILDTPVLYLPYTKVYYGDTGHTGFLVPQVQYNSNSRWGVNTPYYLALSEHYDWTLTPSWRHNHGVNVGNEFRFLTAHGEGEVYINQVLFSDKAQGRQAASYAFGKERWRFAIAAENVSQRDYFQTYGDNTEEKSIRNIPRYNARLAYEGEDWTGQLRLESFETLDESLVKPHRLLPQIDVTQWGAWSDTLWQQQWQYTNFQHPAAGADEGGRLNWHGEARHYWQTPLATFTPAVGAGVIKYHQQRNHANAFHFVPYGIVDAQKNWRHNEQGGNADYFSLRAALIYSAYRQQDESPIYDTTTRQDLLDDFYEANRFAGGDRFSDDRLIAYGFQYRRLRANNEDFIYAGIGQRYYLQDSRVGIVGEQRPTRGFGNILAESEMVVNDNWKVKLDAKWDTETKSVERFYADVRGQLAPRRLLQFGALIDDDKSIFAGAAMPVSEGLEVAARSTYSLTDSEFSKTDFVLRWGQAEECWRLSFVVENERVNDEQDDWSFKLGIELVELGSVGTQYEDMLSDLQ